MPVTILIPLWSTTLYQNLHRNKGKPPKTPLILKENTIIFDR